MLQLTMFGYQLALRQFSWCAAKTNELNSCWELYTGWNSFVETRDRNRALNSEALATLQTLWSQISVLYYKV